MRPHLPRQPGRTHFQSRADNANQPSPPHSVQTIYISHKHHQLTQQPKQTRPENNRQPTTPLLHNQFNHQTTKPLATTKNLKPTRHKEHPHQEARNRRHTPSGPSIAQPIRPQALHICPTWRIRVHLSSPSPIHTTDTNRIQRVANFQPTQTGARQNPSSQQRAAISQAPMSLKRPPPRCARFETNITTLYQ